MNSLSMYPWATEAAIYVGQQEVPGPGFNPWIKSMWLELRGGAWYWEHYGKDDSKLPWCGGFMAFVMQRCGISFPTRYASAKAWLDWGTRLNKPLFGCLCIFGRDSGGHIGIAVGRDALGRILVLGGNQRDGVNVLPFNRERLIGCVWPPGYALAFADLPVFATNAASSQNEA